MGHQEVKVDAPMKAWIPAATEKVKEAYFVHGKPLLLCICYEENVYVKYFRCAYVTDMVKS